MGMLVDEVEGAAQRQSIEIKRSPVWTCESLQKELRRRFAGGAVVGAALWECLVDPVSIQDSAGWMLPGEFAGGGPCLLSFEPHLESSVLEFRTGDELTTVLGECSAFVFYMCDPDLTALVCFNDHDFVIATGAAKLWLAEAARSRILSPRD